MKYFSSIKQNKASYVLSVIISVFFVVSLVSAATTISTNIVTEGTLDVTGKTTLGNASTTLLSVGSTGTTMSKVLHGTCSLVSDVSIAATSTGTGTCVTTGSVAGDEVFVSLATTTTKISAQYSIIGTVAGTDSTTVRLHNWTGQAAIPSATNGFGSSTQYWIVR